MKKELRSAKLITKPEWTMSNVDKAYQAGWDYWQKNKASEACSEGLISLARSCGWHDNLTYAWLDGFFDAKVEDVAELRFYYRTKSKNHLQS